MKTKQIRSITFQLHRVLGLVTGIILVLVGITGSLLVFESEIYNWFDRQQFGTVTAIGQALPVEKIVEIAQTTHPTWQMQAIDFLGSHSSQTSSVQQPLRVQMASPDNVSWQFVIINPFTGKVMGERPVGEGLMSWAYQMHTSLMIGEGGSKIVGIASGVLVILSLTGIVLWPGWRKLVAGFKIKWNAHPKRLNFDLHKVVGIIMAIFLSFAAFTGFCWVFPDWTIPAIYTLTLSQTHHHDHEEIIISEPQSGQKFISADTILEKAQQAYPKIKVTSLGFPQSKTEPFSIYGKSEAEMVYLDPYTAKILRDTMTEQPKALSLGDRITGSFGTLHFGTFAGVYSRILYIFVGLSPSILLITGFIMWWNRKPAKSRRSPDSSSLET